MEGVLPILLFATIFNLEKATVAVSLDFKTSALELAAL